MLRLLVLCICIAKVITSIDINPRIYGGHIADDGMFPYMASIVNQHNQCFCGGAIISKKYILTAAHCLRRKEASSIHIHVGSKFCNEGGFNYNVEKIIRHSKFSATLGDKGLISIYNDIALRG